MKLLEYQGKELFQKYGIPVPRGVLITAGPSEMPLEIPFVVKAQVPSGERGKKGGVLFVEQADDFEKTKEELLKKEVDGFTPEQLLAEEKIQAKRELYLSLSYDTQTRMPVLGISAQGGVEVGEALLFPIDRLFGMEEFYLRDIFLQAGITQGASSLKKIIYALWELFIKEHALLAEINPLFETKEGVFVAGDAKIILDDNVVNPELRPFLDLKGDIAVLASGGGASLINLDALMHFGGKPANYVEYSGNPPASVVEELTVKVLSKEGLRGCWTVGGTANFTDIYETLLGFVQGLRRVTPKPTYPIVIRRDGPRQKEAFEMLREVAKKEGYDFHLYGPEISMSESARIMVELAYGKESAR